MENKQIAVQDYSLVNSKYKLSPAEIKFVMLAIAKIDSVKEDKFKEEYFISVDEIKSAFKTEQRESHLKTFAKKLMSKPLEVETPTGWAIFNFFSKVEYINNESMFRVRIDGDLKPYLLELKRNFVQTELEYIMPMTSQYAVRMYQLLKQYQKLGGRDFILAELQDTLQVPKSYTKKYNDFKTKVLDIAVEQINQNTDLTVKYEVKKVGRRINKLCFSIKSKQKEEPSLLTEEDLETSLDTDLQMMIGLYEIKQIVPLKDGSFKVIFDDDRQDICKSKKQLKYKFDKDYGEENEM